MSSTMKNGSGEHRSPIGNHRRGIVLLLDDEPTLLVALERNFKLAGLFPVTAETIAGANKIISTTLVHCIVADERLKGESGAEFLVDVGRSHPSIGRVLLTAYLDGYLSQRASEHGFLALDKACKFSEVLAAVNFEIGNG